MTIVQTYAHGRGRFYTHLEIARLQHDMIAAQHAGASLVLIGHSWGGSTVIRLMLDKKTPRPDLIVTVDPVGNVPYFGLGTGNSFGGLWVNITARDDGMTESGGNFVAGLWGRTKSVVYSRADVQVDSNRVHEDFEGMLRDAQVSQMIANIRANANPGANAKAIGHGKAQVHPGHGAHP